LIANNLKVKGLVVKLLKFNRIFTNCFQIGKTVHQVHGPVDYSRARSTGPWWTTGGGSRKARRSPALWPLWWGNPCRRLGKRGRDQRGSSPAATFGVGVGGVEIRHGGGDAHRWAALSIEDDRQAMRR
jgi:hypothetical protein